MPGVVTVPARFTLPVTASATPDPETGPDTDRPAALLNARAPVAESPASVPTSFGPPSATLAPLPCRVPTRSAPAPVSAMAPPLRRSRTPTLVRSKAPVMATGPEVALPIVSVAAVMGAAPLTKPLGPPSVMPKPGVYSDSTTVPPGAARLPAPSEGASSTRRRVRPVPALTAPRTDTGAPSVSETSAVPRKRSR